MAELAAIEQKKTDREHKLAELTAKQTKAKAELGESLKRNDEARQDAISLTDYQKKELSEVEARQANIIKQFNADTEQLNKAIADLRARRETELARALRFCQWVPNGMLKTPAFEKPHYKDQKAWPITPIRRRLMIKTKRNMTAANFVKRQLMKEPRRPGRAARARSPTSRSLKPTALSRRSTSKSKPKKLNCSPSIIKRRERVAQVDADARRLREEFDHRSSTKREESDSKREELTAARPPWPKKKKPNGNRSTRNSRRS